MYNYAVAGYLLWRYYYILEYGYSAFYYANEARKYLFQKTEENINDKEEWILIENKEPCIVINEIELP